MHLALGPAAGRFTNNLFRMLGDKGVVSQKFVDWDWITLPPRIENDEVSEEEMEAARTEVAAFFAGITKREAVELALQHRLMLAPIMDAADLLDSPHAAAWAAEKLGVEPAGSGVTCATCHMPKSERKGIATTTHNQNEFLRPNEKMIRPVCMECHGLGFAIDALADPALIANNFSGQPHRHIESIDWAVNRVEQPADAGNE